MKKNNDLRTLTRLALLVAIELVMKAVGLGSVPMGPLYMSFLTLPIAVGAITMGPAAGAILGGVFGAVSFYDAVTGASAMTGALFQVSPVNTFILCVGMRVLMGLCVGLVFNGLKRLDELHRFRHVRSRPQHPVLHGLHRAGILRLRLHPEHRGCQGRSQPVHVRGAAGRRAGCDGVPRLRHSGRHRGPRGGKVPEVISRRAHSQGRPERSDKKTNKIAGSSGVLPGEFFACVRAENGVEAPGRNWSYRCFLAVPIGKNDENAVKS